MHRRTLFPTALLVALAAGPLAASAGAQEEVLKSSDQKKLAKEVAAYWTAKEEVDGINEAFDEFAEKVDDAQKRLKKGPDLLACVDDWRQIFWMATESGLSEKGLKKGRVAESEGDTPFTYVVGKKFSSRNGPYPLLLIAPPSGTSPEEHLEAAWNDDDLRENAILIAVHLEGSPDTWSEQQGIFGMMGTLGSVARSRNFGFDYDRIFLAGSGDGFAAAAATAAAYPHLFAGLIGRGETSGPVSARNLRNLPTLLAGGGAAAAALKEDLSSAGFAAPAEAGDTPADVWSWMESVRREAYPTQVTYSPTASYASTAYWISVDGVDLEADPLLQASADRSSNTITIDAQNVGQVIVYLNDKLVDLDKAVKVVVNGNVNEELLPRNKRTMVDLVFNQGDWGRVFTSSATFAVPAKASE